jgi:hypothetical protein
MLVERFGHVTGCWIMADGVAAIGIVAAIAVSVKEHEEEVAEQKAEQTDTQEVVSDATAQAMIQTPLALLGALFTNPGGATSALRVVRILGRNFPLVLLLVMIGALLWPAERQDAETARRHLSLSLSPPARRQAVPARQLRHAPPYIGHPRAKCLEACLRLPVTELPQGAHCECQTGGNRQRRVRPLLDGGSQLLRHGLRACADLTHLVHDAFGMLMDAHLCLSAIIEWTGLDHDKPRVNGCLGQSTL